tara:strand:- start:72 stop:464 length:393 start_codon:yes stop_codon:yes gene_type:complete
MIGPKNSRGYALLDVVLAVALFALSVTGLVGALQSISQTSSELARNRMIQHRLESMLTETRRLPIAGMTTEVFDELTDITFRTFAEPLEVENGEGNELSDLYLLVAEAMFIDDGGEQSERAELIIYQPES